MRVICGFSGFLVLAVLISSPTAQAVESVELMSVDDRVACELAIQKVYRQARTSHTDALEGGEQQGIDRARDRVLRRLKMDRVLSDRWHSPVTEAMIAAEYRRIVNDSQRPELLARIFQALGSDERLFAECLVRPLLTEERFSNFYQSDRELHAATRAEAELATRDLALGETVSHGKMRRHALTPELPDYEEALQWIRNKQVHGQREDAMPVPDWVDGGLEERPDAFVTTRARLDPSGRIDIEHASFPKRPGHEWLEALPTQRDQELLVIAGANLDISILQDGDATCPIGEWVGSTRLYDPLLPKHPGSSASVWTGAEWLVWGTGQNYNVMEPGLNANLAGMIYDPAIDRWEPMSQEGQPDVVNASAVWTGTEMIVWGACRFISTTFADCGEKGEGWIYNPALDQWRTITPNGAPLASSNPSAIWTGSEMIVWSGCREQRTVPNAAAYDPITDAWRVIVNPPVAQYFESAAWTGEEVLFSGGWNSASYNSHERRCGAVVSFLTSRVQLYNPAKDTWRVAVAEGQPQAGVNRAAGWTGSEWFVWGGQTIQGLKLASGARYRPSTDSWHPVTSTGAPSARSHTGVIAVGSEVVIWGGIDGDSHRLGNGARFLPGANGGSWIPLPPSGAPSPRSQPMMAWTGSEILLSGGSCQSVPACRVGARLTLGNASWSPLLNGGIGAPGGRPGPRGNSDGVRGIVGSSNWVLPSFTDYAGVYDPLTDRWQHVFADGRPDNDINAHLGLFEDTVIVFGGPKGGVPSPSGAIFDLGLRAWSQDIPEPPEWITGISSPVVAVAAPYAFVWGGWLDNQYRETGFVYDVRTGQWSSVANVDAPAARANAAATVRDGRVYLWGGNNAQHLFDGGIYDIEADVWEPIHAVGDTPPSFGGYDGLLAVDGGLIHFEAATRQMRFYSEAMGSWALVDETGGPGMIDDTLNSVPSLIWNGRDVLMWGGIRAHGEPPYEKTNGFGLTLATETWKPLPVGNSPGWRSDHVGLDLGPYMMVWGGFSADHDYSPTGSLYCMDTRTEIANIDLVALPFFEQPSIELGQLARLVAKVDNESAEFATNVQLTVDTQDQLLFNALEAPESAACTTPEPGNTGLVSCSIGTLMPGASREVTIEYQPFALGTYPVSLAVSGNETDSQPSNDQAVVTLQVAVDPIFQSDFTAGLLGDMSGLACAPDSFASRLAEPTRRSAH
jgi:hypothetical protein